MAADQMNLPWEDVPRGNVVLPAKQRSGPEPSVLLAPPPMVDKWPIVIGQGLSLAYLSSVYRLCTQGWRWQWVDAINELLEHDPHARGVIRQRILPIVAAPLKVLPANLREDAPASEKDLAKKVADDVRAQIDGIPSRVQAIARLAWGIIYGLSSNETRWDKSTAGDGTTGKGWRARSCEFIHSRRLNLTHPGTWDVYVYDQGPTSPFASSNLSMGYGLRMADYPGKFVIHSPGLNGDYATRDGEARYIGFYLALKRMIVRASAQDFERVIRPWVIGYFNREERKDKNAVANQQDMGVLKSAVKSLGMGSLNAAVLPDAVRVEILKVASSAGSPKEFVQWLDDQVTESLLGQSYTTGPSERGTHEAATVAASGTLKLTMYDAQCICDTLERDLVYWMVALNYDPVTAQKYLPRLQLGVTDPPSPQQVAMIAKALTACDVPLERTKVGEMAGMPVILETDEEGLATRRTRVVGAFKGNPVEPNGSDDPNDPNYDPSAVAAEGEAAGHKPAAAKPKPGKPATDAKRPTPKGQPRPATDEEKKDKQRTLADRGIWLRDQGITCEPFYYGDGERDRADAAREALLLADRSDRVPTHQVYEQLLEDYPAKALDWILAAQWEGPLDIPLDQIDYSTRARWRASVDPIAPYVKRIGNGRMKPMILVRLPGSPNRLLIVDGHHRALAYEYLQIPARGFVATVPVDRGPWEELHGMQKKGTSGRVSAASVPPSRMTPSRFPASRLPSRGQSRIPDGSRSSWLPDEDPEVPT